MPVPFEPADNAIKDGEGLEGKDEDHGAIDIEVAVAKGDIDSE